MNRLIITLSLAALTLAGCGSAKTVSDSDKKLSRKAAEEYSKVITAEWIADSKTAVADVYNNKLAPTAIHSTSPFTEAEEPRPA